MTKITLGSDPEMMVFDNERRKIVSSLPVLMRDKHDPINLGGGIKLYADNVLAEFSHPPVTSSGAAVEMFGKVFKAIKNHLGERHSLVCQASHLYDKEELKDKAAWETGCNPNMDAYAEAQNPKVEFRDGLRTGSFHIHLGHKKLVTMWDKADAVKLLDIFVGCSSVVFDKDPTASRRRKFYGRAGEFRSTDYGIEWRVLGNYPLSTPELTKLVFDLVEYAATHIDSNTVKDVIGIKDIQLKTQLAINTSNPRFAEKVLDMAGRPHGLLHRVKQSHEVSDMAKAWGFN